MKHVLRILSIALLLRAALVSASGATFVPGDVFSVPSQAAQSFRVMNITGGGDFSGSPGLAIVDGPQNQMAWSADLTTLYITRLMTASPVPTSVWAVSAEGSVSSFAINAGTTKGIVRTADGRLLTSVGVAPNGKVFDITAGGNFSGTPPVFASGFRSPGNLFQLANGHILLSDTDSNLPRVLDITAGGVFTDSDQGFAFGFTGVLGDVVQTSSGRLFVTNFNKVFDITAGGDFSSATPFATGQFFDGLTEDGSGRLLASADDTGKVYDITAGGNFSLATPFAMGLEPQGGTALDTVSAPEPSSSAMLSIGALLFSGRRGRKTPAM